ncbi:uncharacterized protein DDB_G0290685-like isoform X2 [Sycon ciliatum]|uniref:uncharacterized protein DDB_G0290685-like isoform X2 n=1 Tax=Sycon ciliatum TaxID=27933 RepID=UPI0031F6ABB2
MEGHPSDTPESDVTKKLMKPLSLALVEICHVRPLDPLEYLSGWLRNYKSLQDKAKENEKPKRNPSKRAPAVVSDHSEPALPQRDSADERVKATETTESEQPGHGGPYVTFAEDNDDGIVRRSSPELKEAERGEPYLEAGVDKTEDSPKEQSVDESQDDNTVDTAAPEPSSPAALPEDVNQGDPDRLLVNVNTGGDNDEPGGDNDEPEGDNDEPEGENATDGQSTVEAEQKAVEGDGSADLEPSPAEEGAVDVDTANQQPDGDENEPMPDGDGEGPRDGAEDGGDAHKGDGEVPETADGEAPEADDGEAPEDA